MSKAKPTAPAAAETTAAAIPGAEEVKAPTSSKSLRQNAEVETFYRFILENNLRAEAYTLIKTVLDKVHPKSKKKKSAKNAKLQ